MAYSPSASSQPAGSSGRSKSSDKFVLGVIIVFAVVVPIAIILLILRCLKRGARWSPLSATQKDGPIHNGQRIDSEPSNSYALPEIRSNSNTNNGRVGVATSASSPQSHLLPLPVIRSCRSDNNGRVGGPTSPNSSQPNSYPPPEIHSSSNNNNGVGKPSSVYLDLQTLPLAIDGNDRPPLSMATFLTSIGVPSHLLSNAHHTSDEKTVKPLHSDPALAIASELSTGGNGGDNSQMNVPPIPPASLLSNEVGKSGIFHTADYPDKPSISPDTTLSFVTSPETMTSPETNDEVSPEKVHVVDLKMKTHPRASQALPFPIQNPRVPKLLPAPVIRKNADRSYLHVHRNRAASNNQLHPPPSPSGLYPPPSPSRLYRPPSQSGMPMGFSRVTRFSYEELAEATDQFSKCNLLGKGGFGFVYKGILANVYQVAIKQLKAGSGQGDREFQAEVEIISRVHHKHLVSLVGYCMTEEQRILVYEFVPNKSLHFHLHGNDKQVMDWSTRLKIALGSAKGLAYLHEDCHPKIIHRDIKSDNILLDLNFEAKIADFGLAKDFPDDNTYLYVTRVMGTFGYMDPGCVYSRRFTARSDVFSFGVMVLELITGRPALPLTESSNACSLVEWASPLLEARNYDMLVDPRLQGNYNTNEMARVAACAAACVRFPPRSRPRMSQIVRSLEGHLSLDALNPSTMESIDSPGIYSPGLYSPSIYSPSPRS